MAMLVKPKPEDFSTPSNPNSAKPAFDTEERPLVRGFKSFDKKAVEIQFKVTQENDLKRYEQWLHAFTVFNGDTRLTRQGKVQTYKDVRDVSTYPYPGIGLDKERACTKAGVWKTATVNRVYACWLQKDPAKDERDSWGNHEFTKKEYLRRGDSSTTARKRKSIGKLQLVYSRPSYPDPFCRDNSKEPLRPYAPWREIRRAMTRGAVEERLITSLKVQVSNDVMGPPRPEEAQDQVTLEYDGNLVLECTIDFIEKLHRMKTIGHANVPVPVGWAKKNRIPFDLSKALVRFPHHSSYVEINNNPWENQRCDNPNYIKYLQTPRYCEQVNRNNLKKCTPSAASDEARYLFHWRQKHASRHTCNLIDLITGGALKEEAWAKSRMLSRRKGFIATRRRKAPNTAFLVPVGEPYGDYTREEKIALIRHKMDQLDDLLHYSTITDSLHEEFGKKDKRDNIVLGELSTADLVRDHAICRMLGDNPAPIEGPVISLDGDPGVVVNSPGLDVRTPAFSQLDVGVGLWVPKRMKSSVEMDLSAVDVSYIDVSPSNTDIGVKSREVPEEKEDTLLRKAGRKVWNLLTDV